MVSCINSNVKGKNFCVHSQPGFQNNKATKVLVMCGWMIASHKLFVCLFVCLFVVVFFFKLLRPLMVNCLVNQVYL